MLHAAAKISSELVMIKAARSARVRPDQESRLSAFRRLNLAGRERIEQMSSTSALMRSVNSLKLLVLSNFLANSV